MQALRITTTGPEIRYLAAHSTDELIDPEIVVTGTRGNLRWRFPDRLEREQPEGLARGGVRQLLVNGPGGYQLNALALRTALTHPEAGTDLESAAGHLAVVHAAFGGEEAPHFPIAPLSDEHWETIETENGPLRVISAFPSHAEALFRSGRLPSELPVPWSSGVYRVADVPLSTRGELPK
jgi:hypothetical protein